MGVPAFRQRHRCAAREPCTAPLSAARTAARGRRTLAPHRSRGCGCGRASCDSVEPATPPARHGEAGLLHLLEGGARNREFYPISLPVPSLLRWIFLPVPSRVPPVIFLRCFLWLCGRYADPTVFGPFLTPPETAIGSSDAGKRRRGSGRTPAA